MGKTESELDQRSLTLWFGKVLIVTIAIDLQHAFISGQLLSELKPSSRSCIDIPHPRSRPHCLLRTVRPIYVRKIYNIDLEVPKCGSLPLV